MRWTSHPGRTLIFVLLLALIPGATVAQTSGTPESSPEAPQSIWQTLGGVEEAIVRTWGDVPPPGTPVPDGPVLRFVTGLIVQFDDEDSAASSLEPLREWVLASLQVNQIDVELTQQVGEVENLGDSATVVRATGTSGENPLTIAVVVVRDGDRLLAVGASVLAEEDLLPIIQAVVSVMLEREPGGDVERDEMGRFTGGNWSIFPEEDDPVLEGMRRQGDLPIYQPVEATPES